MYIQVGPVYVPCVGTTTTHTTDTVSWQTAATYPVECDVEYTCEVGAGQQQGEQGPVKTEFPRVQQRTPNVVRTRSMRRPHRPPGGWGFYR